ncbi:MAG: hypothetical protein AB8F94_06380 [Saprospiraceae bacterium]
MAKKNIFSMILNTINDVQSRNQADPKVETADPTVFDLIKNKLQNLDQKNKENRTQRGKSPVSILDRIKKEIEGARRENKKDANVATADKSIFDNILKKLDAGKKIQASTGLRKIIEDYNLNASKLPQDVIQQVQAKYLADRKNFDQQYAQAMHDLIKKY